ncbi:MAG: UDP-glucose/GDP-mannose dehydrogenase family protein [Verrucomicrobia bacterium]|nr:UDP-glucose/GDP-mannose dehydrogenase family protein [Verrucomicrobiota bacterium]
MKLTVLGLWHLGCVTAACCAEHFDVVGLDCRGGRNLEALRQGRAPIQEPGLDALLAAGIASGRLSFSADAAAACRDADLLWVTIDTPVDEEDRADVDAVLREIRQCVPALPAGALILVSSQLPVGTCRLLEREFADRGYRFACSPENLRLGQALEIFRHPDRVIVGCRDDHSRAQLAALFAPFSRELVWMRPESAEMAKHAINAFLAASIAFMNEIACLCEDTGADAKEVERALKSESRIGPRAYLSPGGAFAGGTLARDVVTLSDLGARHGQRLEVVPAIKRSNDLHRHWPLHALRRQLGPLAGRRIALLGLTYKPGTDTLRRSAAVTLARTLLADGAEVSAWDPSRTSLPDELALIRLERDPALALAGADAVVVCTNWPELRGFDWAALVSRLRHPLVIDATRFVEQSVAHLSGLRYLAVGSPA